MSNTCAIDRTFGQFGTLWSEMPATVPNRPDLDPWFVGGNLNAVWSVGPSNRPALVVSSWDPHPPMPDSPNLRELRIVLFPADGHPDVLNPNDGTRHLSLSSLPVHCEYLDSHDHGSNTFLVLVRELVPQPKEPGPWAYILRRVQIGSTSIPGVLKTDFSLLRDWLHEPSEAAPMGNLKLAVDRSNATRAVLVSTNGGALRISLLTISQTVAAATTDFPTLYEPNQPNPFVRLRVESVNFDGSHLSVALTAWRISDMTQGLIFRMTVTGNAVTRNLNYGGNGLWQSTPVYPNFRAVRECSNGLVGIAEDKLVVLGVKPNGDQDLEPGFGVDGIAEFDLGGTLLDPAMAKEDRNGWIYFFAQRQSDLATVGARVRVASPLIQVPNGTLDPAFGTNGLVTLKIDGYATAPAGFTLHDGTILDVGLSRTINNAKDTIPIPEIDPITVPGIARMKLSDGSLDAGFGSAGVARHGGSCPAFAFRSDGSCVYAMTREPDADTTVVWVDSAGDFERAATFPPPVPTAQGFQPGLRARSVLINPDGSIWISGFGSAAWVMKLTAAGTRDQTFGAKGLVLLREKFVGTAQLIGWRANGGGIVRVSSLQGEQFLFALTPSGQIDPAFGQAGSVALSLEARDSGYQVQSDGSILVPTNPATPSQSLGLQRVTSTGTIDRGFGVGKSPATAPASSFIYLLVPYPGAKIDVGNLQIKGIVEKGGKLYAIGTAPCASSTALNPLEHNFILITRWNLDGSVDTSYGNGGAAFHGEDGLYLEWTCRAVATERGQLITLGGSANGRPAIWQLTDQGTLDTGFGPGGLCSVLLQELPRDDAFAMVMLPGGKARLACSTGLVQFVITTPPSLPNKSLPERILESVLELLASLVSVFSKEWAKRLRGE